MKSAQDHATAWEAIATLESQMLKIYCDFNEGTDDDLFWILLIEGQPVSDVAALHGLEDGSEVLLYQDADDFEVKATLQFECVSDYFLGVKICARPDWSTLRTL